MSVLIRPYHDELTDDYEDDNTILWRKQWLHGNENDDDDDVEDDGDHL